MELTILMPCLNEARTLPACIAKARAFLKGAGVDGEIVIADNGSTDGSPELAARHGARIVQVDQRGYGAALIAGIAQARGRFVVMGDSDDSYDFSRLEAFIAALRSGAQLVMGNRFAGGIAKGAMPALHRYLGNPVLSFVGRLFFKTPVRDFHCGLRAFERDAVKRLQLRCTGMEFASEMVVKASLAGLRIVEVPTTLAPDGRDRPPHLRSWRDGWRHLRFLLLFSPRWLFLYPGLFLLLAGTLGVITLLQEPVHVGGVTLDVHTLLYCAAAVIVGLQLAFFAIFAKIFAIEQSILPPSRWVTSFRRCFPLELGVALGGLLMMMGLVLGGYSVMQWDRASFGSFDPRYGMRIAIPALLLCVVGAQVLFAAMFIGVLDLKSHKRVDG